MKYFGIRLRVKSQFAIVRDSRAKLKSRCKSRFAFIKYREEYKEQRENVLENCKSPFANQQSDKYQRKHVRQLVFPIYRVMILVLSRAIIIDCPNKGFSFLLMSNWKSTMVTRHLCALYNLPFLRFLFRYITARATSVFVLKQHYI